MKVIITDSAKVDLAEIWEYIAEKNPEAATKLMQLFKDKFELLRDFPHLGRERNHDLFIGSRSLPIGNYLIIYQPTDDILEVVRVRHSATNLDNLFNI